MTMYVPMWFRIKTEHNFTEESRHFYEMVLLSRQLTGRSRVIVTKVLQMNSYFAHQENILVAMITDGSKEIRQLGYKRIIKARATSSSERGIRSFNLPDFVINCQSYHELMNWHEIERTEPPVTRAISDEIIPELSIS